MKKLLALLMILVMLFSFAGCGEEKDVRGEQTDNTKSDVVSEDETDSQDEETESEAEFSMGSVAGLKYENKFIGIGCNLPEGWSFYTDEQIKELNNVAIDMAGEEYEEMIKDASIVYDMYAESSNQMDNINVNLEKGTALQFAAFDVVENYKAIASTVISSYENMGYTNCEYEISEVTIDGKKFDCMNFTAEISGLTMNQTMISIKCSNNYVANIAVTSAENNVADILNAFYLL